MYFNKALGIQLEVFTRVDVRSIDKQIDIVAMSVLLFTLNFLATDTYLP